MKFQYRVKVGNNVLTGMISASTIDVAKNNLKKLGYEVLTLVPSEEKGESVPADKRVFSFEALNKEGKKILGTITTTNEETARTKLSDVHNLVVVKLTDMNPAVPLDREESETIKREARELIMTTEKRLEDISLYDPDYNIIFDAKEEIRQALKTNDMKHIGEKTTRLLSLLQEKETASLTIRKDELHQSVIHDTEDLITSMKMETKETVLSPYNLYFNAVVQELEILSRWLLLFYAVYFVFAETLVLKNISSPAVEFIHNTITSPLLFKISFSLLLAYLYCKVKLSFFENNILSGILFGGLTLLLIILTLVI